MNKKILTIQLLKDRIINMQQELNKLQNKKIQHERKSRSKSIKRLNQSPKKQIRKTSANKRYKSPTFWTGNTILAEENPYFSQKSNKNLLSPSPKNTRNIKNFHKSPILDKIQKDIDLNFYQSAPAQERNKENIESSKQMHERIIFFGKKHGHKNFYLSNQTNKKEKQMKLDFRPRKNPILNPDPVKSVGKKITIRPSLSPQNMFIENPKSNPFLYFMANSTSPMFLSKSPKHKEYFNRNNSPDLKLLLSNSVENIRSKILAPETPQAGKKHYGKYYDENFASKWNVGW